MALNINNLRDELKAEIVAQFGAPADETQLTKFCHAVSKAVITHFTANADIVLATGDIVILPDTFTVGGVPVINTGKNQGGTLSGKVQ